MRLEQADQPVPALAGRHVEHQQVGRRIGRAPDHVRPRRQMEHLVPCIDESRSQGREHLALLAKEEDLSHGACVPNNAYRAATAAPALGSRALPVQDFYTRTCATSNAGVKVLTSP